MKEVKFPIYSIGHGNRSTETFFAILKQYEIDFLIDVRTNPFSRFNSDFSREKLEIICKDYSVTYLFLGDSLGGRPANRACYDESGHVLYDKVMETELFIKSANRLITAYNKNLSVVCMCSESKPCECHRSKMIGRYLSSKNIDMKHIDELGKLVDQSTVMQQVTGGYERNLFGDEFKFQSIGAY
ncbi:DUF488 domain-containing protein [Conchiformibius steedae]|uniref:DUF488 domain-containing protein n=1 Tax=Conchiformibius steedae TaxID=153493 RepID=UPI001639532F|nr:DUF488 domain-containing protein [Conchiformibius steedae]